MEYETEQWFTNVTNNQLLSSKVSSLMLHDICYKLFDWLAGWHVGYLVLQSKSSQNTLIKSENEFCRSHYFKMYVSQLYIFPVQ